jgi:hypothetical protein
MPSPTRQFFYDIKSGMSRRHAFQKFRTAILARRARAIKGESIRPVQGPSTKEGFFVSGKGGKETITKTDALVGKKWSVEAWQQRTQTNYQKILSITKGIDDSTVYMYKGQLMYGRRLKGELEPQVELAKQQFHQALELEKGYTTITKTDEGFIIEPDYARMLREDKGRAAALGWSWGGLGNIDIAYYKLTGQEEKATAKQVEQIKHIMYAKQKLAEGDIGEFSIQYWGGYLSMPSTQIGFAYGAGLGVGAISKAVTPIIASKSIGTQLAIRGGTLAAGTALGGYLSYYVAEPGMARGEWGETLGRSWVVGTGIAAGAAGYRAAFKTGAEYKSFMMAKGERPTFIKEFVKGTPRTYEVMMKKIPGIAPAGYLKGEGIAPRPFGFGRTGGIIYRAGQKVGETKFWQNIYGWAAKGYVPSQTYYLFQENVYYDKQGNWRGQPTLWKRKSWLEKTWIPKSKAESFKAFVGGSGDIEIQFPISKYYSGGEINIRGVAEGKVVKFGRGWFRHTYLSSDVEKSIQAYTKTGKFDYPGGFGSYKRGGLVDIIPDYAPPQRPESFLGKLLKFGYWGKAKPHYINIKGTIEGGPDWISGFGATRPKTSYFLMKNINQWKKIPAGIIRDIQANIQLKFRTEQLMISPAKDFSTFGRQFINVPISGKIPKTPFIGFPYSMDFKSIPKYEIPEIVSEIPIQKQIKIPIQEQLKIPIQTQERINIQEQLKIPIQEQIQTPILTQTQIQKQIQKQIQATKLIETPIETVITTIKTPTIKTPTPTIKIPLPPPVPELDLWHKRKTEWDELAFELLPGYRWREWKTPRLKDIMKL